MVIRDTLQQSDIIWAGEHKDDRSRQSVSANRVSARTDGMDVTWIVEG